MQNQSDPSRPFAIAPTAPGLRLPLPSSQRLLWFLKNNWLGISVLVGLGIVALLPYEFRPGGQVQLLPLNRQQVQARVTGRIDQVLFSGGRSDLIPKGTVIAKMDAPDLRKNYQQVQDQIAKQRALLQSSEAEVQKLLATPRPQEVELARSRVETATQQIALSEQQLQSAINKATFSSTTAERFRQLYQDGGISQQDLDSRERQAQSDLDNVQTLKANVLTQQEELSQAKSALSLVQIGPYPQEIQAAREQVEAAKAELKRLEQEKRYLADQLERTKLFMPFEGRLVTPNLETKVGTYLNQGDTFAEAEVHDEGKLLARVQVPEVAVDQLAPNRTVEVKLLAFPNQPIQGKVVAIQPTAGIRKESEMRSETSGDVVQKTQEADGRVVDILVSIPNPDGLLKPGMSGYAKVEGTEMPVIVAFTRALVRFVKIEVWSWLP